MELDKMEVGQTLEVIANCPSAEEDMNILTRIKGYELVRKWKEDEQNHFLIKKLNDFWNTWRCFSGCVSTVHHV